MTLHQLLLQMKLGAFCILVSVEHQLLEPDAMELGGWVDEWKDGWKEQFVLKVDLGTASAQINPCMKKRCSN